jgi:alkyl sulfatase BDS1-like metallo-beta-lactamase superfamily hydrolase
MNAQLRRRLEMAARVRDFLRAHQMDGVGQGLGLAKLEQLLERGENLATQQRTGVAVARAATKQRQEIRRVLQPKILGYLSVVGAVAATQNAELAQQFRMPPANATHQALLTTSRAILEKATAQKEVLVSLGMSEHVLEELATALGQYEQTLEATSAGRREHVGARADLKTVAAEISEQLRLLDKVVRYRFGDNSELMGAWESARNVAGPIPVRNVPEPGGSQTPKAA